MDSSPRRRTSRGETTLRQLARRSPDPNMGESGLLSFFRSRLVRQLSLSCVLLLVVLLLHLIPSPTADTPRQLMYWVVTNDTDWAALMTAAGEQLQDMGVLEEAALPSWAEHFSQSEQLTEQIDATGAKRPVEGDITSAFGWREDKESGEPVFHSGVDISCEPQTPVRAYLGGEVERVWSDDSYGLAIRVEHDNRISTLYAHLSEVTVKEGQQVEAGEKIALSGQSGRATGPHLHFELLVDGKAVDPEPLLPEEDGR